MEAMEEATAGRPAADAACSVAKGRRTKRQRLSLLLPTHAAVSTSSSTEVSGSTATEEEEAMANCLILLAQGRVVDHHITPKPEAASAAAAAAAGGRGAPEKFTSRRFAEAATTNGKAGFYVYECKTCSKCFPSFQALGGHRASHKKPRVSPPTPEDKKAAAGAGIGADEDGLELSMNSFSKPFINPLGNSNTNTNTNTNTISNKQQRVHECSICGSEFSSGQALGGHMRRHRQVNAKEGRNMLSLDLNLPAPSDDGSDFSKSAFGFAGEIQATSKLVFTASALVDCHY